MLPYTTFRCEVPNIDILFCKHFSGLNLFWLSLSRCPISTICFLTDCPKLEILDLSECSNLVDDDFKAIKSCRHLSQLNVAFTQITPSMLIELCKYIALITLDVTGVKLGLQDCEEILYEQYNTLFYFQISLDDTVDLSEFKDLN
jgi:hypothetical protein